MDQWHRPVHVKIPSSKGIIIHSQLVEFPVDKSIKKHRN